MNRKSVRIYLILLLVLVVGAAVCYVVCMKNMKNSSARGTLVSGWVQDAGEMLSAVGKKAGCL